MGEYWNQERLTEEWTARGLNRRDLMKLISAGAGSTALLTLMGASPNTASAQDGSPVAASGGQVNVLWNVPVTLNPLFSSSGNEQQIERLMFGALVKMSDDLVPTPDHAETIDVSEDGTVYTFTLKDELTFNDGTPLTSADVIFTLERAINPATGSIWQGRLSVIEGAADYDGSGAVSGLAALDERTIEITMAAPNGTFLVNFCGFAGLGILPSHILGDVPPDQLREHEFSLAPTVTAGPFNFVQYATDQYLEVEKSETYPGAIGVDRIFLRILTPDVGFGQLETGELDLMALPVAELERAQGLEGVSVVTIPSPSMDFLAVNLEREYFQNVDVRKAMMYAIDREGIVAAVLRGEGTVVNSSIFGPEWMGVPEGLDPYTYDPDMARSLLEGSGFDTNQEISIMHLPGTPAKDAAVTIMQEQLREVGFNIEILQVDTAELLRRYIDETDFDLFYNAGGVFRADPSISGTYFETRNFTPAGGNGSHYSNPEVDELFVLGSALTVQEERKAVYTQIAQILNAELPWIFLWSPNSIYGFRDRLQSFQPPSYTDNKFWNAESWTVSE
ncbi:ABC transporter substrate-binding protein [soil metagenome]